MGICVLASLNLFQQMLCNNIINKSIEKVNELCFLAMREGMSTSFL